jgi:hypothetical protein
MSDGGVEGTTASGGPAVALGGAFFLVRSASKTRSICNGAYTAVVAAANDTEPPSS